MSKGNGAKQFIYVVRYKRRGVTKWYFIRSDHDPSMEELIGFLNLPRGKAGCGTVTLEAQRYDLDAIPKLPPKSGGG